MKMRDGLVQGGGGIPCQLLLEVAEGHGALVKVFRCLDLLQADGVLHKGIHPPAAVFSVPEIGAAGPGGNRLQGDAGGVGPRCSAWRRRYPVTPQMFSIKPSGSVKVSVLIFCRM